MVVLINHCYKQSMESVAGKISAVDDHRVTVAVQSAIACRRCAAGKGCGAGILQSTHDLRHVRIELPPGLSASVGDRVELSIEPKYLLRAALLAYGVPLSSMLVVLLAVQALPVPINEAAAVGLALVGLVAGVMAGRSLLRKDSVCAQFIPTISGHIVADHD